MDYERLLDGKRAVVTNGDEIGMSVARLFASHGAAVAVGSKPGTQNVFSQPGVHFVPIDFTDEGSIVSFCDKIKRPLRYVEILVNNPPSAEALPFLQTGGTERDAALGVYQNGVMKITRALLPAIYKSGGGAVLNIARGCAASDALNRAVCAAVCALSRINAAEGSLSGVRANAILTDGADLECVADAALFLCSEMASYVTGVTLKVDGGKDRRRYPKQF
ncbi:MAG: SDR family oxidoreductase [Defluviitaleaceae bacterium]|nr:SDR family oxidoreductase [Defluviitaleaceae bacterium]